MSDKSFKEQTRKSVDTSACCAKPAGISDLVLCLTEQYSCPCVIHFGLEYFCGHPDRIEIVKNKQSD